MAFPECHRRLCGSKVSRVIRPGPPCSLRSPLLSYHHHLPSTHVQTLLSIRTGVSVCSGDSVPQTGWLISTENCFSQFWRLESETKALADLVSGEGPLTGSQMAGFSLYLPLAEGRRELCGLWEKGTNPTHEGSALLTNHFPYAPPPGTVTLGIRLQQRNFGGTQTSHPRATR